MLAASIYYCTKDLYNSLLTCLLYLKAKRDNNNESKEEDVLVLLNVLDFRVDCHLHFTVIVVILFSFYILEKEDYHYFRLDCKFA